MLVRVVEDLHRFLAAWKINIDGWAGQWVDGILSKHALVFRNVVVLAADGHGVRYDEVELEEEDERAEPVKHKLVIGMQVSKVQAMGSAQNTYRRDYEQPHANGETEEREHTKRVQAQTVGLEVQGLFKICGTRGHDEWRCLGWIICCLDARRGTTPDAGLGSVAAGYLFIAWRQDFLVFDINFSTSHDFDFILGASRCRSLGLSRDDGGKDEIPTVARSSLEPGQGFLLAENAGQ